MSSVTFFRIFWLINDPNIRNHILLIVKIYNFLNSNCPSALNLKNHKQIKISNFYNFLNSNCPNALDSQNYIIKIVNIYNFFKFKLCQTSNSKIIKSNCSNASNPKIIKTSCSDVSNSIPLSCWI